MIPTWFICVMPQVLAYCQQQQVIKIRCHEKHGSLHKSGKHHSKLRLHQAQANNLGLKLVFLEWSESKSYGRFGSSMLKKPPVEIFEAIGATSGVDCILQVIFNTSSIILYIKILNFIFFHCHIIFRKFPVQYHLSHT